MAPPPAPPSPPALPPVVADALPPRQPARIPTSGTLGAVGVIMPRSAAPPLPPSAALLAPAPPAVYIKAPEPFALHPDALAPGPAPALSRLLASIAPEIAIVLVANTTSG